MQLLGIMKILVLGSLAESLTIFRGTLMCEMVRRGHTVIACAPDASLEIRKKLDENRIQYQNISIERTGLNPLKDVGTIFNLIKIFRKMGPTHIISYTIKPVIYGSIAGKLARIPMISSMITGLGYSFSNSDVKSRGVNKLVSMLYRASLKYNRKVFFQNPDDMNLFLKLKLANTQQSVLINGSGVDISLFEEVPFPVTVSFLMIARLIRQKGVCLYVKAACALKKKYPHVTFNLIGAIDKGNPASISEQELRLWVEQGSIGYIEKLADVRPAIAASSVYVLPSYREGTPRTILEAMAMGRPIVTTQVPGCRETVRHGENGYLVPLNNVQALIEAMERFVIHPELIQSMGTRSRQIAIEKYDVHKVNAVIMEAIGIGPTCN
jgi:glycosyltransferase involved in cell wall biosynthesis